MKMARRIPNAPFRIFRIGATQWTVEDALETIFCDAARAVVVDAHHGDGVRRIRRIRRGERHDALRARLEVLRELLARAGPRRRFEERVHAELAPRRLAALRFRHERDLPAGDVDVALADRDLVGKTAEDRVEPQQVLERGGVGDLADRGEADVVPVVEQPEDVAADPPEPHEPDGARRLVSAPPRPSPGKQTAPPHRFSPPRIEETFE